jgi:hypothetical protein
MTDTEFAKVNHDFTYSVIEFMAMCEKMGKAVGM